MIHINIPDEVNQIINTLKANGFSSYVVGGCVRDSFLGIEPKDWDITTDAEPTYILSLFPKTFATGIKHGTVTIVINNKNFEVTTHRTNEVYSDNRKPDSLEFTHDIEVDLLRRDFTINSIAYAPDIGFIDNNNGIQDIKNKVIRTVGIPDIRFEEDALRMLRAIRFSAQLNFNIEEKTFKAIENNAHLIQNISHERIRNEISKILISQHPEKILLLHQTKILKYILPEFENCFGIEQNSPYHIYDVAIHSIKSLQYIQSSPNLRWCMLLHDIGKPVCKSTDKNGIDHFHDHAIKGKDIAKKILDRLKFDNQSKKQILTLIEFHRIEISPDELYIKKLLQKLGIETFENLLQVQFADNSAKNPIQVEKFFKTYELIKNISKNILFEKQCIFLSDLKISGKNLIDIGFVQGPIIHQVLSKLLNLCLAEPKLNEYEKLIDLAKKELYKSH